MHMPASAWQFSAILLSGAVLMLWVIRRALLIVTIEMNSMLPTLEDGDRVVVIRPFPRRWISRGMIVLLHSTSQYSSQLRIPNQASEPGFVKRIVALAGDLVVARTMPLEDLAEISDSWRCGWLRPSELHSYLTRTLRLARRTLLTYVAEYSSFAPVHRTKCPDPAEVRTWRVPRKHVFVRGDYPGGGFDSINWGPVPIGRVIGVVVYRFRSRGGDLVSVTHS